ncbi:hypothetical protein C5167_018695 [Papaver somniferum]|uniref:Uncharacterized protein n=1 Tax=Papaver somniferum TaxID=3469 RepID=A0A4Y7IS53_PAPSO|nr:hypothetical protein C5167_018695 [Papaver somniferum]
MARIKIRRDDRVRLLNPQNNEDQRSNDDGLEMQSDHTTQFQRWTTQQRTSEENKFVISAGDDQVQKIYPPRD